MKSAMSVWASAAVVGVAPAPAMAVYTGLTAQLHTTVSIGGQDHSVFRIYANFDDPGDRLVAVFGSPSLGSMTLQSRNGSDTDFGNPFYNNPTGGGGITAPSEEQIAIDPDRRWDTFATIGLSTVDQSPVGDFTSLTPGFQGVVGTEYVVTNGAWYSLPTFDDDGDTGTPEVPPPQTLAGWTGDGDDALRVMLLQLTVVAGDNVRGTINIDYFPPLGTGGGTIVVHQPFQTFNTFIPAPSSVALLLVAAAGRSRRRAC
jgi:hypothetical protein